MSAQLLSAVAGVLLSLLFSYIPGASDWFAALDGTRKRLVMLGALVLVAAGSLDCPASARGRLAASPTGLQRAGDTKPDRGAGAGAGR